MSAQSQAVPRNNPIFEPVSVPDSTLHKSYFIEYNPTADRFVGENRPQLDSFPTILRGVSTSGERHDAWYKGPGLCVRLSTFGGRGVDTGDLACLFHSSGKSLLPALAHPSPDPNLPRSGDEWAYAKECFKICHNFKANVASYCLKDIALESKIPREELERQIKMRFTLRNGSNFTLFFNNFIAANRAKLNDFRRDWTAANDIRNVLLDTEKDLVQQQETLLKRRQQGENISEELTSVDENLSQLRQELLSPELEYNQIRTMIEQYYLDPRYEMVSSSVTGGNVKQYLWPAEIRKLPLTTGLFTVDIFDYSEQDIREEGVGPFPPIGGHISLDTIVDQLLSRQMYGSDYFRFIAGVTGFNIFMLTPQGEPHSQRCVSRVSINIDIVQTVLTKITIPESPYETLDYDPISPCIVILYQPGHFESVALLHEMPITDSKIDETVYQGQTVFSINDPFIQAILAVTEQKREFFDYAKASIDQIIRKLNQERSNRELGEEKVRALAEQLQAEARARVALGREEKKELSVDYTKMSIPSIIKYLDENEPDWRVKYAVRRGGEAEHAEALRREMRKAATPKLRTPTQAPRSVGAESRGVGRPLTPSITRSPVGRGRGSSIGRSRRVNPTSEGPTVAGSSGTGTAGTAGTAETAGTAGTEGKETLPTELGDITNAQDAMAFLDRAALADPDAPNWRDLVEGTTPEDYAMAEVRNARRARRGTPREVTTQGRVRAPIGRRRIFGEPS
jgi:hypothetical protein